MAFHWSSEARPDPRHRGPQRTYETFPTCHGDLWGCGEACLPRMNPSFLSSPNPWWFEVPLWVFLPPRAIVRGGSVWGLPNLDSKIYLEASSPAPDWPRTPHQYLSGIFLGPSLPYSIPITHMKSSAYLDGRGAIHSERGILFFSYCLDQGFAVWDSKDIGSCNSKEIFPLKTIVSVSN